MADTVQQHVFVLDGLSKGLEATEILEQSGMQVNCFTRVAECLEQLRSGPCHLLITNIRTPEMDGIQLMREAKRLAPWLPVLIISDQGDIRTAVNAIKAGAVDFIQRPLNKENFAKTVRSILRENEVLVEIDPGDLLTRRERRVLALVIEGNTNKEIAALLHRSVKTIETHRHRIMRKLRANNLVDLVKRAAALGLVTLEVSQRLSETMGDSGYAAPSGR